MRPIAIALSLGIALSPARAASDSSPLPRPVVRVGGTIRLMESTGCRGNQKGTTDDRPGQAYNFKKLRKAEKRDHGFTNDDAKSVELTSVRSGALITVYDSPSGQRSDDFTEIQVVAPVQSLCVATFEQNISEGPVRVTYHRNNGLDGKVSRLEVR